MFAMIHSYVFTQVLLVAMVFPVSRASMGGPLVTVANCQGNEKGSPTHEHTELTAKSIEEAGHHLAIRIMFLAQWQFTYLSHC